jgi:RNA polymerase sigma-70 factor (ECF subfamily)
VSDPIDPIDPAVTNAAGTSAAVGDAALLYEEHVDAIHTYVARRIGRDLAADVTAETFRIAIDQRHSFDPARGSARAWLFGIATNLIRRHWRTEERRLRAMARSAPLGLQSGDQTGDLIDRVAERVDAGSDARAALAAVAELESADRELLVLIVWEELRHDEVAQVLGIPSGTVRSRLHRIRRQLRESMSGETMADGARARGRNMSTEETTHG